MRLQHLDRDLAIELGILRRVHDTHATGAEHVEHDVAAESCSAFERWRVVAGRGWPRSLRSGRAKPRSLAHGGRGVVVAVVARAFDHRLAFGILPIAHGFTIARFVRRRRSHILRAMLFPAPPAPAFDSEQSATTENYLRYEDVTQDGRLMPIAVPPAMGGLWRSVLVKHPGAAAAARSGILPILTRMTIASLDTRIRVDRPVQSQAGFQLAHVRDDAGEVSRLFMNLWVDIRGAAGTIVPRTPAGPLTSAGRLFAEHTFTRPFGPPDQRRVTRLGHGYPEVPDARYPFPAPSTAGDAPDGATWLDELAPVPGEIVFTLDHTDSNQHVNSLVYIQVFLDALYQRIATTDRSVKLRSREVDIAYRKPCFAGDRVRAHLRLFEHEGTLGGAGFIATDDDRPRCYVRAIVEP